MSGSDPAAVSAPLSLGIDVSTQSITGVVIDPAAGEVLHSISLSYAEDPRLNSLGIDHETFLVPPRREGEADQPPALFLAAADALFADLAAAGAEMSRITVINFSAQQHGHVYLNSRFEEALGRLAGDHHASVSGSGSPNGSPVLHRILEGIYAYGTAPIWMTSDTEAEAARIREKAGGRERMIELSGSDSPLRFTGAVVRRVGNRFPEEYRKTGRIMLLNTFLAAVLAGRADVPADYGNACGMSLMNYRQRRWDAELLEAAAGDLPGGADGLWKKLGGLAEPFAAAGTVAGYFRSRYGFPAACLITAGSGDNPQTKVLVPGDLLSLGTSFVNMVATGGGVVDSQGYANAMYDGLGRPFMFGCRTNGALVWDRVRSLYGLSREEYGPAEEALRSSAPGGSLLIWQPARESFPDSPEIPLTRLGGSRADLASDYSGIIDSSLTLLYHYSRGFSWEPAGDEPLYVTGGPTESGEILRRVAGIWNRRAVTIGKVGAALGAAAAGLETLRRSGQDIEVEETIRSLLPVEREAVPDPSYVRAYHGEDGYIRRLTAAFEEQARRR
jgi:xylulokinase